MLLFGRYLTFALIATCSLVEASADTVLAALKNPVDPDITSLGSLADSYTGTSAQSLNIKSAVDKLIKDVNAVTTDIKGSATLTEAQCDAISRLICGQLLTDLKATITKLKNKRAAFTNAGLRSTIKTYLTNLKTAIDSLVDAIIAKAPTAACKSAAQTCKNNYDSVCNDAITYYS